MELTIYFDWQPDTSENFEILSPRLQDYPKCLIVNAVSLAKPDAASALIAELSTNNVDICKISETWLAKKIWSSLICPNGYTFLRKGSDHLAVMVTPRLQAKAEREHVYVRDVRHHRKITMENKLKVFDWSNFYSAKNAA